MINNLRNIRAAVIGADGYTGVELLTLLTRHPHVTLCYAVTRRTVGHPIASVLPHLRGICDEQNFCAFDDVDIDKCDVVFFATPHGTSMTMITDTMCQRLLVIDLSADFRLQDAKAFENVYQTPHVMPQLLPFRIYGLSEYCADKLSSTGLVANPGCYPTAVLLPLIPLLAAGIIITDDDIIADCKSGVSGAGKRAEVHYSFSELANNFFAYSVEGHRHLPEMLQGIKEFAECEAHITFVPHLLPVVRGMLATLYLRATLNAKAITQLLFEHYADSPFIHICNNVTQTPQFKQVVGTNNCIISIAEQDGRIVITSMIDNLLKGAAGQAIQNMNIAFGLDQRTGLNLYGRYP